MTPLRLILVIPSLVFALLAFFPVSSLLLWQMKLGAIEFGHWFALFPLLAIFAGRRRSVLDSVLVGLAVLALALLLSSSVRAAAFAPEAKSKMTAVFPAPAPAKTAPFSWGRLWSLGGPPSVEAQVLNYSEKHTPPLALDFYPTERGKAPCVVVLHGGGWDGGSRREFAGLNHFLASRGYAVAAIDYRLAPGATWPAQRDDVIEALGYLTENASQLSLNPHKFVLLGRSAGGQIAGAVAATGKAPGVVGCITLSAPADLHFAAQYAKTSDILNSKKLIEQYLGGTPADHADAYDSASAPLLVNAKAPPFLLIHGEKDDLVWVRQSVRFAAKLAENEVRHVFLRPLWATHALDYGWNTPGGQLTQWAIETFLASVTAD
jgi:acetyl esterase/lipase